MPRSLSAILTLLCVASTFTLCPTESGAAEPKPSFEDTFQRDELGTNWTVAKGDWRIVDGSLVGKEKKEDAHAAVLNCNRPNHNSTIQFSFKLDGADFFHLSFNHAKGHLFRVMVTSKGIVLRTDKNKKDPASKPVTLAKDDTEIEQGKWHTMRAELNGENVTIQINDEIKLRGSHPSLDVDKPNYRFVVRGDSLALDNLKIWAPTN